MAKLKTVEVFQGDRKGEHIHFKYDVNVNTNGDFTTTLPEEIVEILRSYGIEMKANYFRINSRPGYFEKGSLTELTTEILDVCRQALSRTLSEEKLVIKYQIQTACHYMKGSNGTIIPNGMNVTSSELEAEGFSWKEGTKKFHGGGGHPFGMAIWVHPYVKRIYSYANGNTKEEYILLGNNGPDNKTLVPGENLLWLNGLCHIRQISDEPIKEIDYSESVAAFFVKFIKTICEFNEKIKDFLEPDKIQLLAQQTGLLLSSPKE